MPDPQDPATFERSRLRWDEIEMPAHQEMLEWYRSLLALRRRLTNEQAELEVDEHASRISVAGDRIVARVNLGQTDWVLELGERDRLLMRSEPSIRQEGARLCLPPWSVAIVETEPFIG